MNTLGGELKFKDYLTDNMKIKYIPNWYEEYIEEPIRPVVKLLRDNGFNTVSSCGHDMEIQCDVSPDGEFYRLHRLLYDNGHRDYKINFELICSNGCVYSFITLQFKDII